MVLKTIVTGAYKPTYNWGASPHIVILIDINVTETNADPCESPEKTWAISGGGTCLIWPCLSGLGDMPPESGFLVNSDDEDWASPVSINFSILRTSFRQIAMEMDLLNWHGLMGCSRPWVWAGGMFHYETLTNMRVYHAHMLHGAGIFTYIWVIFRGNVR